MKHVDFSKIENQVGCGWCSRENSCDINEGWKQERERIPPCDRYKNRPVLTCGQFMHVQYSSEKS
jgi:hypothetical protein